MAKFTLPKTLKNMPMLGWLLKAGAFTAILRVVAMVVTLVFVSVMSQLLPKTEFGTLALLISVVTLAGTVGALGQSEWMIKHASPQFASGDADAVKRTIAEATKRVICFSTPIAATVAVFFWLRGDGAIVAFFAALNMVSLSVCIAWAGASRSVDKLFWSLAPKDIFWRGGTIIFSFVLIAFGVNLSLDLVALGLFGVLFTALLFQSRTLNISVQDIRNAPIGSWAAWVTSLQIMISMVSIVAQNTLDVLFIGTFMSSEAAAEYFPANRIALLAGFFFLPIQMILGPKISRIIKSKDTKDLQKLLTMGTALITIATILIGVMLIFGMEIYLKYFPTATASTEKCIIVLTVAQIICSMMGFPGLILIMTSRQSAQATINISFFLIGMPITAITAIYGNIETVATTISVIMITRKAAATFYCARKTGIFPVAIHSGKRSP